MNISQMKVNMPYMDPMGTRWFQRFVCFHHWGNDPNSEHMFQLGGENKQAVTSVRFPLSL